MQHPDVHMIAIQHHRNKINDLCLLFCYCTEPCIQNLTCRHKNSTNEGMKNNMWNVVFGFTMTGNITKQVRAKQGGGTRKLELANNAGLKDIIQEECFPDGISAESDFEFEVWAFKQKCLADDTCQSVGTLYEPAKLTILCFYSATKPKKTWIQRDIWCNCCLSTQWQWNQYSKTTRHGWF